MIDRPKSIIILILLWLALSGVFLLWGGYTLATTIDVPSWSEEVPDCDEEFQESFNKIIPILHFGFLMSTIVWFVFSSLFIVIAYGTYKKDHWVWTTGLIISTIFLAIFGLMLASFMINVLKFRDDFSIFGLTTVMITFLIDLGIIFYLTRPTTKIYFGLSIKK